MTRNPRSGLQRRPSVCHPRADDGAVADPPRLRRSGLGAGSPRFSVLRHVLSVSLTFGENFTNDDNRSESRSHNQAHDAKTTSTSTELCGLPQMPQICGLRSARNLVIVQIVTAQPASIETRGKLHFHLGLLHQFSERHSIGLPSPQLRSEALAFPARL